MGAIFSKPEEKTDGARSSDLPLSFWCNDVRPHKKHEAENGETKATTASDENTSAKPEGTAAAAAEGGGSASSPSILASISSFFSKLTGNNSHSSPAKPTAADGKETMQTKYLSKSASFVANGGGWEAGSTASSNTMRAVALARTPGKNSAASSMDNRTTTTSKTDNNEEIRADVMSKEEIDAAASAAASDHKDDGSNSNAESVNGGDLVSRKQNLTVVIDEGHNSSEGGPKTGQTPKTTGKLRRLFSRAKLMNNAANAFASPGTKKNGEGEGGEGGEEKKEGEEAAAAAPAPAAEGEDDENNLHNSKKILVRPAEHPKFSTMPLCFNIRFDNIYDEPKDSMIKDVLMAIRSLGVPHHVARDLSFTIHGAKWPPELRYSRFRDPGVGSATGQRLSTNEADDLDKTVDNFFQRAAGRVLATIRETLYNGSVCRYDVVLIRVSDNPKVKKYMANQDFLILLRQSGRLNFQYVPGFEPVEDPKKKKKKKGKDDDVIATSDAEDSAADNSDATPGVTPVRSPSTLKSMPSSPALWKSAELRSSNPVPASLPRTASGFITVKPK